MTSLTPEALTLLPAPDESVRCAEHTRTLGVSPGGTAITADAVAVVEVPLPWPKPVFDHDLLQGLAGTMPLTCGTTRVFAAQPRGEAPGPRVTLFERAEVGMYSWVFDPADHDDLLRLFDELATSLPGAITEPCPARPGPELAVLVCTQGSHDVCCGSEGVRLAQELAAPGLDLFQVSHTGGHRFAPTAMTLPDGRMWAGIDAPTLRSILELTGDPARLASTCRGWWGAPGGPGQVAEIAVLAELGWDLDALPRSVSTTATSASSWTVEVDVARQRWTADVVVARVVPTISCRAAGGLPAKPGLEYEVASLVPPC